MFPVICKIGPFSIYSYGLMLAVAVITCSLLLSRDAKNFGIHSETVFELVVWGIVSGLMGARVFFIR